MPPTGAPCVCVPRDDRWGRTYEGFSEDTATVQAMGAASIDGFQGAGLSTTTVMATANTHGPGVAEQITDLAISGGETYFVTVYSENYTLGSGRVSVDFDPNFTVGSGSDGCR